MMVADLNEGAGSSNPGVFTPLGDQLLFTANDGTAGFELWSSDGTANDTSMVDDINPGPGSSFLDPVAVPSFIMVDMGVDAGTAFFAANDGTWGMELWRSDGTPEGTTLVKDILPGPTGAFDRHVDEFYNLGFANLQGNVLFVSDDGVHGLEPWVSDGTEEGTQLVLNVNDTPLSPEPGPLGNTPDSSSSCQYGFQALLGGAFGQCHQAITGWELWTVQAEAQPVTCGRGELEFNATIVGTDGDDIIHGTPDSDVIHGLGGNDGIFGLEGDDIICGGPGNDILKGDQGNDTIYGNSGKDKLMGGEGNDDLVGGTGKDRLFGEKGNDELSGGEGEDILKGGRGEDRMNGGAADDVMIGGPDVDKMSGGKGNDRLSGRGGQDELWGGEGDDTLRGGRGQDDLVGGQGDDELHGGDHGDYLSGREGADTLYGESGRDELIGGIGDDKLRGGTGADRFYCGSGFDEAYGGNGVDVLLANAQCETVVGIP